MRLGEPGRPIEDACFRFCNAQYHIDLDRDAPTVEMIIDFIGNAHYPGRGQIDMAYIAQIGDYEFNNIIERINNNVNIAVIGAQRVAGGHATMILKKENILYAVDPIFHNQGGALIAIDDIELVAHENEPPDALQCVGQAYDMGVIMNYCFVITLPPIDSLQIAK